MDVLTRENGIIAAFVVLAIVAFYHLSAVAEVPDRAVLAVVVIVGVLLPGWLTGRYST